MVLTIYGIPKSTSTKRIAVTCIEKNIPFAFKPVNMRAGEHKTQEYLDTKQPFGQIPYIEDDGVLIYESRAICRYICSKYASQGVPLVPPANKLIDSARFETAASVELCNFDSVADPLVHEVLIRPSWVGIPARPERVAEFMATLNKYLDGHERILSKSKYIAGDSISLIDLFYLPWLDKIAEIDVTVLDSRPHVARWYESIYTRPSWQAIKETVPDHSDELDFKTEPVTNGGTTNGIYTNGVQH